MVELVLGSNPGFRASTLNFYVARLLRVLINLFQRYEYSPLVDDVDTDDDEDMDEVKTKSNLTQNLKKRGGDSSTVAQIDQDEKMVCNTFYMFYVI